ncbi:hypothetical protein MRX96_004773 [Rhipicephalus microplus]
MKLALLALCTLCNGANGWFGASMRSLYSGPDSVRRAAPQLDDDVGEPLFLTPLIEAGLLSEARYLSRVGSLGDVHYFPSHSGFLTANKTYNSNLFFWFFPAEEYPEKAPVVLWLQGGPGASSLFGLFVEHGPYLVAKGGVPEFRNTTWTKRYSMLYIDNPVGAGFSFTQDDNGYARNEDDVGRDLHEALQQFFTLFDEYATNDFYATGESYAGKYVPAIAHAIDTAVGLADRRQADYIRAETIQITNYIKQGRYLDALFIFDKLITIDTLYQPSYFKNITGSDSNYNFLLSKNPEFFTYYQAFVDSPEIRKVIHVGNLTFNNGEATEKHLREDIMQSVKAVARLPHGQAVQV